MRGVIPNSIQQIESLLSGLGFELTPIDVGNNGHYRAVEALKAGVDSFQIQWWMNQCYLFAGELIVPFKSIEASGTWPNRAKMNLQFYSDSHTPCAILPIQWYDKNKEPTT